MNPKFKQILSRACEEVSEKIRYVRELQAQISDPNTKESRRIHLRRLEQQKQKEIW